MPPVITVNFINRSSDAGNSQVVIFEGARGGPPVHTLRVHNHSGRTQTFVCFQAPKSGTAGYALAWFAMPIANGVEANFTWQETYDLVWVETGSLAPGVQFGVSQVVPASLGSRINLTFEDGAFSFSTPFEGPPGQLMIACNTTIPTDKVSVGIGMAGSPTEVAQASPNTIVTFNPLANYWVTVADVTQGEVIDVSKLASKAEVIFPGNVTAMTATLSADQNWTVQQGLAV
jgi:hypothetical protein